MLTCICSGGGGGLWKGSQHSGGSSSGGIRRSGANSAVLELHADVIVGPWRCVLRHGGGECEGQCRSAVRIGQSHSTRINPRNPAFLHLNHYQHVASRRIINRVLGLGYNRVWRCLRWSILNAVNSSSRLKSSICPSSLCLRTGFRKSSSAPLKIRKRENEEN